ncbi:MAG TPA: hypothetical protein VF613_20050 [Longimicrobium sp.]
MFPLAPMVAQHGDIMLCLRILAGCALIATPRVVLAQSCGDVPAEVAEETRAAVAPLFFDSAEADLREASVRQLAPGEIQQIVRDDSVCAALVQRAVAHLRATNSVWRAGQEGEQEVIVFRFGPYYAVSLTRAQPVTDTGLNVATGWSPLVVFRAGDHVYIHTFAH